MLVTAKLQFNCSGEEFGPKAGQRDDHPAWEIGSSTTYVLETWVFTVQPPTSKVLLQNISIVGGHYMLTGRIVTLCFPGIVRLLPGSIAFVWVDNSVAGRGPVIAVLNR